MEIDFRQSTLFESAALPYGLIYQPDFVGYGEEASLLAAIAPLPFREARFRDYFAKRRVVHFDAPGHASSSQSTDEDVISNGELPPVLAALLGRVTDWLGLGAGSFVHALVSEYRVGTPIGWHRDKPPYGIVVGVSLRGRATMRFRPHPGSGEDATKVFALELEPRSAYVMQGPIRWQWQHSMPATKELRYSVTFRTRADEGATGRMVTPKA